jgi:alginate O-acetyltransferase complex protein AlgI
MVDEVFGNPAYYTASSIWMASIAYAVQIFCDFSGYSEMAIACAGLMGFRFEKNFDYPYLAANIVDFWRRWHISLSTWLRDYLYIPLGGSRGALSTTYRNLLLTMVLGGLWHGAGWTFILWGLLHGVALVANKEWQRRECGSTLLGSAVSFCSPLLTFWWVVLCWIFFRAETMTGAATMVRAYLFLDAEGTSQVDPRWGLGLMLLAVVHVLGHAIRNRTEKSWQALPEWAQAAALGCLVACIIPFIAVGARPFIYFQF